MFGLLSLDDATNQLQAAIEFGDLVQQQAPAGHPIYSALDDARELMAWLRESASILATSGLGSNTESQLQAKIDAIYSAAATLRNDPDQPLPRTIFPALGPGGLSWGWVAGGAAVIAVVAVLFQQQGRKRRR